MYDHFGTKQNIHRKVLVVDDELINRLLLGNIVGRDYDVLYAENGVQAMEQIKKNAKTLSLVMLDLMMPEKDGYEVLEELKNSPELCRIPTIVLTSEKSAEVKSLSLGAADFISKPYDMPEVIMARVRRSIELAESYRMLNRTERDSLTGLYNKEFFMEYCERYNSFYPNSHMDALVVNINKFHIVNELYGRDKGNHVLQKVADVIAEFTSGENGLACRNTGDVFYLFVPHRESYDDLVSALNSSAGKIPINVRIGICEKTDSSVGIEQQFDHASLACGKHRGSQMCAYVFYDTSLREKELYNERLLREMNDAIKSKQFCVYFQPKYNIRGDKPRLTSAEALIRWIHPELGFISPGAFIPVFEENGLIHKLDRYVWNETAAQIRRMKDKYGLSVPISVNVSRVDIYDPKLEETLLETIKRHDLETSDMLLEITESEYTNNSTQIIDTVTRLRNDGFKVEMDDFGTGYSSLNMLSSLPIDVLKLDMSFMRHICENEKDLQMVKLILDIAKYLGVSTVAEGVEKEEQYHLLKDAGCDVIQGYYFSRPLPSDAFEKLFEEELSCLQ